MGADLPKVPPNALAALRALEQFNRQTREVQAVIAASRSRVAEMVKALRPIMDVHRWQEEWARALPDNWSGMDWEAIKRMLELMEQTRCSLVWVPSQETLRRLLRSQARDPARRLKRFERQIVADLERSLRTRSAEEVRDLRSALREAVATHKEGRHFASQALAASAVTASVHQFFNPPSLAGVRKQGRDLEPEEVALRRFRRAVVFRCVARALDQFVVGEDPVPGQFNRHAVAHTVAPEQFTRANSLAGILLGVSVTCEIEYELREELPAVS